MREDYELCQAEGRPPLTLELALSDEALAKSGMPGGVTAADRAALRVCAALRDLGPGLADVALRVCCQLEGVETAERRMGWAARSGKIVLRIALERLRRHYDETYGRSGPMIG